MFLPKPEPGVYLIHPLALATVPSALSVGRRVFLKSALSGLYHHSKSNFSG